MANDGDLGRSRVDERGGSIEAGAPGSMVRAERPDAAGRRGAALLRGRSLVGIVAACCVIGLALGGVAAATAHYVLGGHVAGSALGERGDAATAPTPIAPADMVFAAAATKPDRTPDLISADAKEVLCFFEFREEGAGTGLWATWQQPGASPSPVSEDAVRVDSQADHVRGVLVLRASAPAGFPVGIHQVEIGDAGGQLGFASFAVARQASAVLNAAGPANGPLRVTSVVVTDSIGADGAPGPTRTAFPPTGRIYAAFRYADAEPGMAFTVRWEADGSIIEQASQEVVIGSREGWGDAWIETPANSPLPHAEYVAEVVLPGGQTPAAQCSFTVP